MRIKNTFSAPCLLIIVAALLTAVRYIDPALLSSRDNIYLSLIILQFLTILLPTVFYMKLKGKGYVSTLKIKMFMPDSIAFVLLCMLALIAGSAALRFICEEIGIPRADMILMRRMFPDISPASDPIFSALAYAITPAVIEELLFRGVFIAEYRSGGRICATVMSALLFAFMHYGFENLVLAFFVGSMLALAVYVTGSVWSAVIIRAAYNLYSVYLETQLFNVLDRPKNNIFMTFIFVGVFLIVLIMMLGCAEKMFYSYALAGKEPEVRDDSYVGGKVDFKSALSSIPFLLAVILYIIISI